MTFYIKKLRPIGIGLLTAFLLTSIISIKTIIDKSDFELRIVTFDSKTWKSLDKKPISMARDIFLNWGHCQDKQTLIELIGTPFENGQSNEIGDYEKDVLANSLFYKTDIELASGLSYYLIFHFPTSNADCNSIHLRVLGENAQIDLNKYID